MLVVRNASRDELALASTIILDAYHEFRPIFPPERWDTVYARWGDVWSPLLHSEILVAVDNDRLLGVVIFYPNGSLSGQGEWPAGWAGMARLAVRPEHRRQGVGRALTEACIHRCRQRAIATLGLHTTDWMVAARALYERLRFTREPSLDWQLPDTLAMGYRYDVGRVRAPHLGE